MSRYAALVVFVVASSATLARADEVLQRRFDPELNGPWTVVDLGTSEANDTARDPKRLAVAPDGTVYVYAKRPLSGPPQGTSVLRIDGEAAIRVGSELPVDGDAILIDPTGMYVGTKGTAALRRGEVYRLDGDDWVAITGAGIDAEVRTIGMFDGAMHVGTANDGVWRVDLETEVPVRVGVRTVILPEGYSWSQVGDYLADIDRMAVTAAGDVVTVGKDLKIRRFAGGGWTDLGNLSEATYDATGAIVSFVREPKSIAIAGGVVYVGTKGGLTAPEGANIGAVWAWDGAAWQAIGTTDAMRKEVKAILAFAADDLVVGSNETGVFAWNGVEWTERNQGLPADATGKRKAETLTLGSDGNLYLGMANTLYRSTDHGATWTELGFLALGEEIKSIATTAVGAIYVGTKLGDGSGAVFRLDGTAFTQVGGDLIKEARHLVVLSGEDMLASLGGGGGAVRWNGVEWTSVLGNLTGDAADVKQTALIGDAYYAATKVGIQQGVFSTEVEIVESPLAQLEIKSLWTRGADLYVGLKRGGVFQLVDDANGDDGHGFAAVDQGLPDVEFEAFVPHDDDLFAVGKPLLYRAPVGEDTMAFSPLGTNPGAAQLDGDGNLVFTGATEFKAVAAYEGRLFAGTKDGLFVSEDDGATWTLFNGPAEVKALQLVGSTLYVAVKGEIVPDPIGDPTARVQTASIWIRDLEAVDVEPPVNEAEPEGCGCSVGARVQRSPRTLIVVGGFIALAIVRSRRRRAS
jgi:hypothetical protein